MVELKGCGDGVWVSLKTVANVCTQSPIGNHLLLLLLITYWQSPIIIIIIIDHLLLL